MIKRISLFLALAFFPLLAPAHYLWIESEDAASARVYFGEYNEGVREKAGGRLDERKAIEGRIARPEGAAEPLRFTMQADHFATKTDGAGWLLVEDRTSEVKDWSASDIGIVKPIFYARASAAGRLSPAQPAMTLDLIPDAKDPRQLRVFFNQQPLAKAKVLVHAPNQWSQEIQADEAGAVSIATPWPGRYVVEVIHKERVPGEFQGKRYEAIRHRVTFTHVY